ncbi:MAG TPA: GNAT family N-acetyltransferase [Candidatus Dormibacteraeota bacterium]|nr:GNAT family N-acetyltransferase [Candidatus Dormibacteraeota bacterium]
MPADVTLRRLTPQLGDDLLGFLGSAFPDNPHWASCFCAFHHVSNHSDGEWGKRSAEQNRELRTRLIAEGRTHGVLAYRDGEVVGWCHADPRVDLNRFEDWGDLDPAKRPPDIERIGAIVCFVVRPGMRRQGIAKRLLEEACALLADMGLEFAEGYPQAEVATEARDGLSVEALNYQGTPALYAAAGFAPHMVVEPVAVMRRPLRHPGGAGPIL